MSTLSWILLASVGGGVLSIASAGLVALSAPRQWIPLLVAYAVGALLGAVFLEILPHAFELAHDPHQAAASVLAGILIFFVLEKLVLWRHSHGDEAPEEHNHDHGRSGLMIMVGDTIHNLVDGVIIAAAFTADRQLGVVTSLAIIAHEIPQEVGDFLILLHSGFTRGQALAFNLVSSLATVVGGVIAYFALANMQSAIPPLLGIAAASMLYVAVADLIPGLHRRLEPAVSIAQVLLISLGIASIWLTHHLLGAGA